MKASDAVSEMEPAMVSFSRNASARCKSALVEPQRGVFDAGRGREAIDHGLGVGPARHQAWVDEGGDLDVAQAATGQRLDQRDLVGGRDRAGLDLEALARPLFADVDAVRQVHALRLPG